MDDMFYSMPDQTKAVLMKEAIIQAEATLDTMLRAAEAFKDGHDLEDIPEEALELTTQFFDGLETADHALLSSMFIHGFFGGASFLFRMMNLLDSMAEFLNSDCEHLADIQFGDADDDDDTDRAGLPRQKPGLSSMNDEDIRRMINNMQMWKGFNK